MAVPYRADQVGSFLRPRNVVEAHQAVTRGELPADELRKLEDAAILEVLKLQQEVGIDIYSDGEFRRGGWGGDFGTSVEGYVQAAPSVRVANQDAPGAGGAGAAVAEEAPQGRVIGARLQRTHRLTEEQTAFLKQHAPGPIKMTMPAASHVTARGYRPDVTDKVYGNRAGALHAVAEIIQSEIQALAAEGVPYIQLDNPHYTDYVSERMNAQWRAAGIDLDQALADDIAGDNFSLSGFDRSNVILAMHLCRGNGGQGPDRPAGWHKSGSYDAVAERLFAELAVDRWLLEYDSERAGGFEPLRFMPKDKQVVLGLVTTKSGELETQDELLRRIEEAGRYFPLEQMALSPQCGFASTLLGNPLTVDEERRKLELVVDTARKVWS